MATVGPARPDDSGGKSRDGAAAIGGGTAVVLSGAFGGAKSAVDGPAAPTVKALTAAEYQAMLADLDAAIAPAMGDLVAAKNPTTVGAAVTAVSAAVQAGYLKLKDVNPPPVAANAHSGFVTAVAEFAAGAVETGTSTGGGTVWSSAARHITTSTAADSLRSAIKALAAVAANALKAGEWLPVAMPTSRADWPTARTSRRAAVRDRVN